MDVSPAATASTHRGGDAGPFSVGQRNVMMALLILGTTCSAMDRFIIAAVTEPLKQEFALSDSQLGFVTGTAFSLAHAVVCIPLGFLGDRVNRRNLVAAAIAAWSLMTGLCGLALTYVHVVLARMGVGAAEAGAQSSSLSMVSDLFPARQRATAVAVYYLANPIGAMLAAAIGGAVAAAYGWRAAMFVAAIPGLFICVALLLFGRHPPREGGAGAVDAKAPPIGEVAKFILSQRAMLHVMMALALTTLVVGGVSMFGFSFFVRYHGMNLREVGSAMGAAQGTLGIASLLAGGFLADRVGRRDPRNRLWVGVVSLVVVAPTVFASYVVPGAWAMPLFLTHMLITNICVSPAISTIQNLAPPRMRAATAGVMYTAMNVFGFGLGPLVVGTLSDLLAPQLGVDSLRWALVVVTSLVFWAALHFYLATRTLIADLARADAYALAP